MKQIFFVMLIVFAMVTPAFAQSLITFDVDTTEFIPGEIVELRGTVDQALAGEPVAVEIKDTEGNVILIRTVTSDINGEFMLKFKVPSTLKAGELDIVTNVELDGESFSETKSVDSVEAVPEPEPEPEPMPESESICGEGTIMKDGKCVVDTSKTIESDSSSNGGGCLIATATYGSELAPQVQKLREIRDNQLLGTESGTKFMNSFNDFYYSFSPYIADYERENPVFKEMVKLTITPMLSTLSLMEYAESESEVLGIGISLILLNAMMYVGIPAIMIMKIRK